MLGCAMKKRVRLKSFNGTVHAPADCRPDENYWALIGEIGEIVGKKKDGSRTLVKFQKSAQSFGLIFHNPVENSLFILESDLEPV
jgi:hypothetical protein